MHHRQLIRDAIKIALRNAETLAGENVFTSRSRPVLEYLQRREGVISVYTPSETSQRSPDGHTTERTLTVSIEGVIAGGDELDDVLDDWAQQVEVAVNKNPALSGLLSDDLSLTSSNIDITSKGNMQVGAFRLDYECKYITSRDVDAYLPPAPPLPDSITVNSSPSPIDYDQEIDGIRQGQSGVNISRPPITIKSACDGDSCAIPAWEGDQ